MDAAFGLGLQRLPERLDPLGILRRQKRAGRVGDIDAFGPVALHQPGLLDQLLGRAMCAIIRKPTASMPSLRAASICCLETSASVQCVAMRTQRAPAS